MPTFQIRPLTSLEDFRACERIQKAVWGGVGVSSEVLSVTAKYGGAMLGAVSGGRVVGFLYAFLARRQGRLIHWSHMMALAPGFRDRGLGLKMKLAHRKRALAQGVRSICWTYDPLQSRNAWLNVARLGANVEEYVENCYGRFPSRIERGLASDRFVVNWKIGSAAVARRLTARNRKLPDASSLPRVNETRANSRGLLENRRVALKLETSRIAMEIPPNTDTIRARDAALAARWRVEARRIFKQYFSRRYRVVDFVSDCGAGCRRCFYVLDRT